MIHIDHETALVLFFIAGTIVACIWTFIDLARFRP